MNIIRNCRPIYAHISMLVKKETARHKATQIGPQREGVTQIEMAARLSSHWGAPFLPCVFFGCSSLVPPPPFVNLIIVGTQYPYTARSEWFRSLEWWQFSRVYPAGCISYHDPRLVCTVK
jgi:hypothetical protein